MEIQALILITFGVKGSLQMRVIPLLFTLSLFSVPDALLAQPIHDEPCSALPLPVNADCIFMTVVNTDATLTTSVSVPDCGSLSNADVWYTITVPAAGRLRISTSIGTITDAAMSLYSAPSCDGPFTLLECNDDGLGSMPLLYFTDLLPNSTLYLRVWGYGGATGDFSLCAFGPLEIPDGDCVYLLEMTDSYGDGWGTGAQVDISINGSTFSSGSLEDGTYSERLVGVNVGDLVTLNYTAGSFYVENGIRLTVLGLNPPLYAGVGMFTNTQLYTGIVDCAAPPPAPGDCRAAMILCRDTLFPLGALAQGYEVDLDATNQGCLGTGEQDGIWARVIIATDGTLAFTLTPTSQTDYDFAVWGPMPELQCPPVGAPVRCSFSAAPGTTGLSTSAVDLSEGAGGDGRVAALSVLAGEQYVLYINNFSQNGLGLGLTWQLSDGATLLCPAAPEANFVASLSVVLVGEPVNFTDLSTNDPSAWEWMFTGGTPSSSTSQNPIGIVYDAPGCYDVSLTAYNPGGEGSTEQLCSIQVDVNTGLTETSNSISILQELEAITVRSTEPGMLHAMIYDAMGRQVLNGQGNGVLRLDTGTLSSGPYMMGVSNATGSWSRRVFISK